MSILINGMDMPEREALDICIYPDGSVYYLYPDADIHSKDDKARASQLPSADVAPVKHGKWLLPTNQTMLLLETFLCSKCYTVARREHNYCPNCGARMDGEE